MASDNKANYAKIGFVIILGAVLALGALIYLGGFHDASQEMFIETYFPKGVSGLDVGSAVNFRGLKVGEVREISFIACIYDEFAQKDGQIVWVKIACDTQRVREARKVKPEALMRALIARGLKATVTASGITGLSRIELDLKPDTTAYPCSWQPRYLCVPPAPSILDTAADSADRILEQLNRIDLVDGWTNAVNALLSVQRVLDGTDHVIQSQTGKLGAILDNVRDTTSALRDLIDELKTNPSLIIRARDPDRLEETR